MDNKSKILDIAMNLNRIGNWAADGYNLKRERIKTFLNSTTQYVQDLEKASLPPKFRNTFDLFLKNYKILEKVGIEGPADPDKWAEDMMTWGNILTHRSNLLEASRIPRFLNRG